MKTIGLPAHGYETHLPNFLNTLGAGNDETDTGLDFGAVKL
jgi:hypothetical protein